MDTASHESSNGSKWRKLKICPNLLIRACRSLRELFSRIWGRRRPSRGGAPRRPTRSRDCAQEPAKTRFYDPLPPQRYQLLHPRTQIIAMLLRHIGDYNRRAEAMVLSLLATPSRVAASCGLAVAQRGPRLSQRIGYHYIFVITTYSVSYHISYYAILVIDRNIVGPSPAAESVERKESARSTARHHGRYESTPSWDAARGAPCRVDV